MIVNCPETGAVPVVATRAGTSPETSRIHLLYLEGIRGWAAVFVALHHVWQLVVTRPDLGGIPAWFSVMTVLKFGGYAVPIFIVLSGYCLMLPVARSGRAELTGGFWQFAIRRARRILIPYYAALALLILLIASYPRMAVPSQTQWDIALPALSFTSVVTHLALVHNWFVDRQWTIDPPMWSIGIEWQIYFVFALVLLPLWRRIGPVATVAVAFVLGLAPMLAGFRFASPWFLGLFACGMFAAAVNFTPGFRYRANTPWVWESVSLVLFGVAGALTLAKISALQLPHPLMDAFVGVATAMLLVACTRRLQTGSRLAPLARALEHRVSTTLGEFSYSFYLLHYPLLAVAYFWLIDARTAPMTQFAVLTFVALPAVAAVSYGFHRVFERPFMLRRTGERSLHSAVSTGDGRLEMNGRAAARSFAPLKAVSE